MPEGRDNHSAARRPALKPAIPKETSGKKPLRRDGPTEKNPCAARKTLAKAAPGHFQPRGRAGSQADRPGLPPKPEEISNSVRSNGKHRFAHYTSQGRLALGEGELVSPDGLG